MREKVRDIERLLHIQNAINVLMTRKDTHSFEDKNQLFDMITDY